MGAHVFRKGLMRTVTDIQVAEIHSYGQGSRSSTRRAIACMRHPSVLRTTGRMSVGVRNDTAIIRLPRPVLAEIPVSRWASCVCKISDFGREIQVPSCQVP